ncbi:MAG TPA: hypothetical protein ENJ09_01755 [Planctomycetes bacterium]|nr:hypothetical protein [Planctomycetota bacterium]
MAVLEQLRNTSEERFLALYEALADQGFGPLDHEVAKALKFRPQKIRALPMAKRARQARRIISGPKGGDLAYEFFGTYLVKTKKELVTGFLDATGVPHNDAMIEDPDASPPDPEKIPAAIEALDKDFDEEDVTLYLALCVEMWPGEEALRKAWESRLTK